MKILKITLLALALALAGSSITTEAKVRKQRNTTRKEKKAQPKKKARGKTSTPNCGLDMVEYSWQGMMMIPVANVRVERKNGKVIMAMSGTVGDEKEQAIADGEEILKQALEIIEQEKMLDYALSYSLDPSMRVLDGSSWSFAARLADGRHVSSRGSNAEPSGNGLSRMQKLLFGRAMKLIE